MKISEQWLREWVNPSIDTNALAAQITMAGLEVDSIAPVVGDFNGVVIGEVLTVDKHPSADKLSVCSVFDGNEHVQVVCGASNVRVGLKVPFARVGACLPGNLRIEKAKLRGVESHGMLCSSAELGLSVSSEGLLELDQEAPVGMSIRRFLALDDQSIEVELTPNRSDCLSIAGVAREVAVLNKLSLIIPDSSPVLPTTKDTFPVKIIDREGCPKYLGRVIKGVDLTKATPLWMKEKLRRCGLRSIDPAVDVTNYIMLELGQPMHAFDLDRLSGSIVVRRAEDKEKLTLLDGQEIVLRKDTLVIADERSPLAIAGVMGGHNSGVGSQTANIFLECAFFSPLALAGKARSYGLHTESSHRFERGVDYQLQRRAIERATRLLLDIVGGEPGPIVEEREDSTLPKVTTVGLRAHKVEDLLGVKIATSEVEEILTRLGLKIMARNDNSWVFEIPSYRFDISIEQDLIEEIGRIYGYNNLPKTTVKGSLALEAYDDSKCTVGSLADRLVSLGYQEAITYSFVEYGLQKAINPTDAAIALHNPISADMSVMRTSLWPGLLNALKYNQNRQQHRIKLFETGLRFVNAADGIVQTQMLAGVVAGPALTENWCNEKRSVDFFDVKADLESLLGSISSEICFERAEHCALHPGQTAQIVKQGQKVGFFGKVHPELQKSLDLNGSVYMFELCLEKSVQGQVPHFSEISKFPEVRRDLAVLIGNEISFREVEVVVRENAGDDLVNLFVFDVYSGENLGDNLKSLALGLVWQRLDRTLNDEEIARTFERIISALSAKFNAKLRS